MLFCAVELEQSSLDSTGTSLYTHEACLSHTEEAARLEQWYFNLGGFCPRTRVPIPCARFLREFGSIE